jgi:hypothetical protein
VGGTPDEPRSLSGKCHLITQRAPICFDWVNPNHTN